MTVNNEFLDATWLANKMLTLLHAELGFVGSITQTYSNEFAKKGAKIGETVQVRMPNRFKIREGREYERSLIRERSFELSIDRQRWVDLVFTSADLTLDVDKFADRFLRPAAKQLATHIEWDVLSLANQVSQAVYCGGPGLGVDDVLRGKRYLDDSLVPASGRRGLFCPSHKLSLTQSVRDQYNPAGDIARVYQDRAFGRLSGFNYADTTVMPPFTSGAALRGETGLKVKTALTGNNQSEIELKGVREGVVGLNPGDSFAFKAVHAVHPETKVASPYFKRFSVVSVEGEGAKRRLTFTPKLDLRGPYKNVSIGRDPSRETLAADTPLLKVFPAGGFMESSLLYHPDAFAFVTADLEVPKGVDFAARESHDGLSMRLVRDYDSVGDRMLCRFDVLYGYGFLDESLACRLVSRAPD